MTKMRRYSAQSFKASCDTLSLSSRSRLTIRAISSGLKVMVSGSSDMNRGAAVGLWHFPQVTRNFAMAEKTAKRARQLQMHNMNKWIKENEPSFEPPVCNKLMYGGELKVMFVGGPNVRDDYHMEEGEELFFQVRGSMVVKIMEKGKPKDVEIKEGEVFVLPSRIPHSPQRKANTVGLVIERERLADETDGLRYYCKDGSNKPLWEAWFHCEDLGTQLEPVIKQFFSSKAHETGIPDPDHVADSPPINLDTETTVHKPFSINEWLESHKDELAKGPVAMFDKGEFKVMVVSGAQAFSSAPAGHEVWLWQYRGSSELFKPESDDEESHPAATFAEGDVVILPPDYQHLWKQGADSIGLHIWMDPQACK
eukprot:m.8207 g.8207  ORF g.8207 m.8207 type:complete len:367 (+) comp2835_c0_seq2:187-1287(+)